MNVVGAAALGLGLGAVTGMPLGVINVAIVDAASAGRRGFAQGLGLGGAAADCVHAAAAFLGVGTAVTARPALVRVLAVAAAVAIAVYAVAAWRGHRRTAAPLADPDANLARGAATGFALTIVNVGALGAWIAVAAALWPAAAPLEAALLALGVGTGSALWFTLLARLLSRVRRDHPAVTWIPRAALVLLVALAAAGAARAFW